MSYGLLKFPQIADIKGYAVAEAYIQLGSGNDDGSAKQLELAIKLAERDDDRKVKKGRVEYGGYSRGGGRGGRGGGRQAYGYASHAAPWQGSDPYMYAHAHGYGHPQMPAAPGFFMPPPGPGPAQVVKALGPPMQQLGAKASRVCFACGNSGHYAAECPSKNAPHSGM